MKFAILAATLACAAVAAPAQPQPVSRAEFEALARLAQRANDAVEVQNLMSLYTTYSMSRRNDLTGELFVADDPTATLELGGPDIWVGSDNIRRRYKAYDANPPLPGDMHQHTLASPNIVIAGDGQTARAMWDSPGHDTGFAGEAAWNWAKYGADFKKQGGRWRIWHLKVFPVFTTPYETSWVENAKKPVAAPPVTSGASDTRPAWIVEALKPQRTGPAKWIYNGKGAPPPLAPEPPLPYETWNPENHY